MAKILVQDESEEQVWRKANDVAAALNSWNGDHGDEVAVIGPYEDVIKKIRNKYRLVLSLTGKDLTAIKKPCSASRPAGRPASSSMSIPYNRGESHLPVQPVRDVSTFPHRAGTGAPRGDPYSAK